MVYKDFNLPSENMKMGQRQLAEMIREQEEALYKAEEDKAIIEQNTLNRELEDYATWSRDYLNEQITATNNRNKFLENVKTAFMTECVMHLFKHSVTTPMTDKEATIARNLSKRFVVENGAGELINSFALKNRLLSEYSRICKKYYDLVVEDCNNCSPGDVAELNLNRTIADDFYKELEDVDVDDATKLIRDRVSDAINDFVDTNMANKVEYQDIIATAQDKIAATKDTELAEGYANLARRQINDLKIRKPKSVFNVMVESYTKAVITNDNLKQRYMHETAVDMDAIVDSTKLIYTMLEMVNTTNMVNVDAKFIQDYLESIA